MRATAEAHPNIALVKYFWKLAERKLITHVIVPVLGMLALLYPLYAVANPAQSYPFNLVPIIVLLWIAAGVHKVRTAHETLDVTTGI